MLQKNVGDPLKQLHKKKKKNWPHWQVNPPRSLIAQCSWKSAQKTVFSLRPVKEPRHGPVLCSVLDVQASLPQSGDFRLKPGLTVLQRRPSWTAHWEGAEDWSSLRTWTAVFSDPAVIWLPISHIQIRLPAHPPPAPNFSEPRGCLSTLNTPLRRLPARLFQLTPHTNLHRPRSSYR